MIWNHPNDVSTFRNFQIHVNISFEIPTKKKDIEKLWKVDVSVGCFRHERGAGKVTQH